ncbi:MAG: hypothetical protein ABI317_07045 [Gaiellales bacterium]
MSSQQFDGEHGEPARKPGDRMLHESKAGDQRPRERRRDHVAAGQLVGGAVGGAVLFVLVVVIVRLIHGAGYSPLVYIVAAVVGGGAGMVILPYLSLARADGADANVVRNRAPRGQADTPIEGAEAVDDGHPLRAPGQRD